MTGLTIVTVSFNARIFRRAWRRSPRIRRRSRTNSSSWTTRPPTARGGARAGARAIALQQNASFAAANNAGIRATGGVS